MRVRFQCTCTHEGDWHDQDESCEYQACACYSAVESITTPECPHSGQQTTGDLTTCMSCGALMKSGGQWLQYGFVQHLKSEIERLTLEALQKHYGEPGEVLP